MYQRKWVHAYINKNRMSLDDDSNFVAVLIDMYANAL